MKGSALSEQLAEVSEALYFDQPLRRTRRLNLVVLQYPCMRMMNIDRMDAAKSWAFLSGRKMVLPEDIQAVSLAVINHRISNLEATYRASAALAESLVKSVEIS